MFVTLLEAWQVWLSGQPTNELILWGVSIFWWGRIGKILQTVGFVTLIAEIIGPERIRAFRNSIIPMDGMYRFFVTTFIIPNYYRFIRFMDSVMDYLFEKIFNKLMEIYFRKFAFPLIYSENNILTRIQDSPNIPTSSKLYPISSNIITIVIFVPLLIFALMIIIPISVAVMEIGLVIFFLLLVISLLDLFIFLPTLFILENKYLDKLIKLFILVVLVLGFHFDLLSS